MGSAPSPRLWGRVAALVQPASTFGRGTRNHRKPQTLKQFPFCDLVVPGQRQPSCEYFKTPTGKAAAQTPQPTSTEVPPAKPPVFPCLEEQPSKTETLLNPGGWQGTAAEQGERYIPACPQLLGQQQNKEELLKELKTDETVVQQTSFLGL